MERKIADLGDTEREHQHSDRAMVGREATLFLFALTTLMPFVARGQPADLRLEHLTTADGLSSSLLTDIAPDERGFLWIATLHGLNRYDGREIVQFHTGHEEGALPAEGIHRLLSPGDGRLLAGTDKGLAILDLTGRCQAVIHLDPGRAGQPYEDQVLTLNRDALGQYWAGTPTTLYRLDSSLVVQEAFRTQDDPIRSRNRNLHDIITLPSGELLCRLRSGWHYWSPGSKGLERLEDGAGVKYDFLPKAGLYISGLIGSRYLVSLANGGLSVHDLADGRTSILPITGPSTQPNICGIWGHEFAVAQNEGVSIYTLEDDGHKVSLRQRASGLLPGSVVSMVTQDREGNYWVGTNGGLVKVAGGGQAFHNHVLSGGPQANEGTLEPIDVLAHGRHLFIGTNGEGFFQVDPATGEQVRYTIGPATDGRNIVWNIRATESGDTLWLGTQQGVAYYTLQGHRTGRLPGDHPAVLDAEAITLQFEDSRQGVWFGIGRSQGAARHDRITGAFQLYPYGSNGYPFLYPMQAGEDAQGNLWFTSDATGNLVEWDHRTRRFRVVEVPGVEATINIQSGGFLLDRKRNEVWYGILPAGLVRYGINDGGSTVFGTRNGLPGDRVNSIAMDGHRRLWLATDQGISCLDAATGTVVNYTRSDGLAAVRYTAIHYDPVADRISAAGPGTLTWFTVPEQLTDARTLTICLTGVQVNGKAVMLPGNGPLSLGPDEGHVNVKFTAVNLSDGRENRYQYRLNEGEWSDLGHLPEIRFAGIKAGSYRLEARAARKLGAYGPASTLLEFTVRPRFTSTPWFYLLVMGALLLIVWAWYDHRIRSIRRLEAMRAQISRDLHDEIGSRLTNINMMSQVVKRASTGGRHEHELLGKIREESEEITQNMRDIIWNIDPRNDQLALAMPRMLSYASQLLESRNITVEASMGDLEGIQVDMAQRKDLMPIFKEAIHNIVKHSGATVVRIGAQVQDSCFHLAIEDNGKGFDPACGADGNGLRNMRTRAAAHGWALRIESGRGRGTCLFLVVPFT